MEIPAQHGMITMNPLADFTTLVNLSPEINAATVAEDATLMTAVISTQKQTEILKKKKPTNARMTILLETYGVIHAQHGMIATHKIAEYMIPIPSILLSCAVLVEVDAKEVKLALNSNLQMNGQKKVISARTTTLFMILMETPAPATMIPIQINVVSGILTHLMLSNHAASALVETSTMMVSAKTMSHLPILMVIPAQATMTSIQKNAVNGTLPISTLMNNAALALEEIVEYVLMTSQPLMLTRILANTTLLTLMIAGFTMTKTSTPWNSAALVKKELLLASIT